jgi:hypothetical protein
MNQSERARCAYQGNEALIMGNSETTHRQPGDHAESDAYVTFDTRAVILDLPDDGRVADLLPARGMRGEVAPAGSHQVLRYRPR